MILSAKRQVATATTKRRNDRRCGAIMVVAVGADVVASSPTGITGGEGVFASGRDSFSVLGAGIARCFPVIAALCGIV